MEDDAVQVNLRRTARGEPKGSYTVHRSPECKATKGRADRNPVLWTTSTIERIHELAPRILFGACRRCWPLASAANQSGIWAATAVSVRKQASPSEARKLLQLDSVA